MANYTVVVDTQEGDRFRGIYPATPTRDQVVIGIREGTNAPAITRLIAIVKAVRTWPTKIVSRRIEVVREEAVILGKIIFDRSR